MRQPAPRPISGHVFKRKGKRGAVWYAKYRLPDGRQQKRRLGPAWTEKTAPPDGYFSKGKAEKHLDELLRQTREGTLPGLVQTGKTFADASAEWLAYCENVRDCKPSTLRDYRNMVRVLDREFGRRKIETITTEDIDLWISGYGGSNRTRQKYLVCLGSIFKRAMKVYGLPRNPADLVERPRVRRAAKIDVLRPEEVLAFVRAAESEQDAAIFHTAAFAGLRMGELLALRWRDVDFTRRTIHVRENWTQGETTTPKGGTERAVPMAEEVAERLARLGQRRALHRRGRSRLLHGTRPARRLQVPQGALPRRAACGGPARGLPLPQPPPHLRQHRDPPRRLARGHGVDGPRRPDDDQALSRLRRPRGRRQAGLGSLPAGEPPGDAGSGSSGLTASYLRRSVPYVFSAIQVCSPERVNLKPRSPIRTCGSPRERTSS